MGARSNFWGANDWGDRKICWGQTNDHLSNTQMIIFNEDACKIPKVSSARDLLVIKINLQSALNLLQDRKICKGPSALVTVSSTSRYWGLIFPFLAKFGLINDCFFSTF